MSPTLEPGDRVLLVRGLPVRAGHLVGVIDPRHPDRLMIKRVVAVQPEGVFVEGDNAEASTDSRHFGAVPPRLLQGRVVYRYFPEGRRGCVARR